jgi:hypothetical protein
MIQGTLAERGRLITVGSLVLSGFGYKKRYLKRGAQLY